jgi:hypothetical protein
VGPPGPAGLAATNDGGTQFTCKPLSTWCEGSINYACTRSGLDATGYDCARLNSAGNTFKCFDTCPNQASGACCALANAPPTPPPPECVYSISSPESFSGDTNTRVTGVNCDAPDPCTKNDRFYIFFNHNPQTCPTTGYNLDLNLSRSMVPVGSTVALPSPNVNLSYYDQSNGGTSCSAWTGSVTFTSDAPNWQVVIDATCTMGLTVHLQATFHGTVT